MFAAFPVGHVIAPRLYYVPESELSDDPGAASASSFTTLKDLFYKMKPMVEDIPFQWAQALFCIAGLMSMCVVYVDGFRVCTCMGT